MNFNRDRVVEPLYAIVPYYNPFRWKSRVKHTERALKHFHDSGAVIVLVEIGLNRRELIFADSGLDGTAADCGILGTDSKFRHKYIGLHSKDELWQKESSVNHGVQHLPYDWQQVCWLDADVHFVRPNWVGEAIHKLQHGGETGRAFLQMFTHARDVGPNYELLPQDYPHANGISFVQAWKKGIVKTCLTPEIEADLKAIGTDLAKLKADFLKLETDLNAPPYYQGAPSVGHIFPGLAWACTRPAWDAVGGLIDIAVWGGADHHQALALIGASQNQIMRSDLHRNYKKIVNQWAERCRTHIRRNVLVMEGTILHAFHGRKDSRGYNAKHALLAKYGFDPLRHLKRDSQGLWMLHDDGSTAYIELRDTFRKIAKERDEDSNDARLDLTAQGH